MVTRGTIAPTDELMRVVLRLYDQDAEAGSTGAPARFSFLLREPASLAMVLTAIWLVLGSIQLIGTLQARSGSVVDPAPTRGAPALERPLQSIAPAYSTVPDYRPSRIVASPHVSVTPTRKRRATITRAPRTLGVRPTANATIPAEVESADRPLFQGRTASPAAGPDQPATHVVLNDGAAREGKDVAGEPTSSDRQSPNAATEKLRDANDAILALRLR